MQFRKVLTFMFSASLAFTLFLSVILCYPGLSVAGENAVVTVNVLNVRDGPGTGYWIVSQVGLNERLPVLDKSDGWCKVQLSTGTAGWVAGWHVNIETTGSPIPKPNLPAPQNPGGQLAVVNGNYVNIRSGPGTGYGVISQVNFGDRLPVLGNSDGWCKVQLPTGTAGWVAGWLVNIETNSSPVSPPSDNLPPTNPGGVQDGGKSAVVTGSVVNIRSGPGTSNAVTGQVVQGDTLAILDESGGWYKVKLAGGGIGWIAGWLVSVQQVAPPPQQPKPPSDPEDSEDVSGGDGNGTDVQSGKALSLEVKESAGKTSVIVEVDVPFDYSAFVLSNPDRLVVDLKGVAIGDLPQSTTVNSKSVKQVRTGYFQKDPDITRLVFDIKDGVQYITSLSGDRKKLTVQTYIPDISGSYKGKVVTIDAGHGGPEPGAIGSMGTKEKDINLDVAKRVARLLEARGAKVVMTRSGDWDVGLYERANKSNNAGADVFVSIHMNANDNKSLGGTSTYVYSGSKNARIQESTKLARYIQAELVKSLGLRDAGVRYDNFAVLRTTDMPAVLAEVAFISNIAEEKMMWTDNFKNKASEAIVKGIGLYFFENAMNNS